MPTTANARTRRAATIRLDGFASTWRGVAAAAALVAALTGRALAQDAGSMPQTIVASTTPLSADQKAKIQSFVEAQAGQLATGDGDKMTRARNELASLPGRPGATEIFQREYAALARPALEEIVAGPDEMRAVNALIVIQALRTPEAVAFLLERSDPKSEKRIAVRTRAASSLADAIATTPLSPAQVDGAVRGIVAAASAEPEWVPVLHAFRALARASALPKLPAASTDLAVRAQSDLLAAIVERIAHQPAPQAMVAAVAQALVLMRDQFTTMSAERVKLLRQQLVGSITSLARSANKDWDALQGDDTAKRTYGAALGVADLLLSLAAKDRQEQMTLSLGKSWEAGDKAAFEADLKKIEAFAAKR
ncbi:MAG: hypothetical protein U0575_08360 [Phycisphaerales bacterium]